MAAKNAAMNEVADLLAGSGDIVSEAGLANLVKWKLLQRWVRLWAGLFIIITCDSVKGWYEAGSWQVRLFRNETHPMRGLDKHG